MVLILNIYKSKLGLLKLTQRVRLFRIRFVYNQNQIFYNQNQNIYNQNQIIYNLNRIIYNQDRIIYILSQIIYNPTKLIPIIYIIGISESDYI